MERDSKFRNRWVWELRKNNCVCSTHVMVRVRLYLFLELSVSASGPDDPHIFLTHSHHGNILYEISGSPLNLNPSLIMVVKDLPCFQSMWEFFVGFSGMSSLLSCLPYFIPRAGSELWLNWCHISGVASTNRYNQGNNMGVEGGKNETGAGRTEMSIFSYSAPKTTPTRGTPYKNNQWKQGEQPPRLTDLCIENVTFWARYWSYELVILRVAFSLLSLSIQIRI